jgi:hypothetical protein
MSKTSSQLTSPPVTNAPTQRATMGIQNAVRVPVASGYSRSSWPCRAEPRQRIWRGWCPGRTAFRCTRRRPARERRPAVDFTEAGCGCACDHRTRGHAPGFVTARRPRSTLAGSGQVGACKVGEGTRGGVVIDEGVVNQPLDGAPLGSGGAKGVPGRQQMRVVLMQAIFEPAERTLALDRSAAEASSES